MPLAHLVACLALWALVGPVKGQAASCVVTMRGRRPGYTGPPLTSLSILCTGEPVRIQVGNELLKVGNRRFSGVRLQRGKAPSGRFVLFRGSGLSNLLLKLELRNFGLDKNRPLITVEDVPNVRVYNSTIQRLVKSNKNVVPGVVLITTSAPTPGNHSAPAPPYNMFPPAPSNMTPDSYPPFSPAPPDNHQSPSTPPPSSNMPPAPYKSPPAPGNGTGGNSTHDALQVIKYSGSEATVVAVNCTYYTYDNGARLISNCTYVGNATANCQVNLTTSETTCLYNRYDTYLYRNGLMIGFNCTHEIYYSSLISDCMNRLAPPQSLGRHHHHRHRLQRRSLLGLASVLFAQLWHPDKGSSGDADGDVTPLHAGADIPATATVAATTTAGAVHVGDAMPVMDAARAARQRGLQPAGVGLLPLIVEVLDTTCSLVSASTIGNNAAASLGSCITVRPRPTPVESVPYGSPVLLRTVNLTVARSAFTRNKGRHGPVYVSLPSCPHALMDGGCVGNLVVVVVDSVFQGNEAAADGAALYIATSDALRGGLINITSSDIANNTAGRNGGAIAVNGTLGEMLFIVGGSSLARNAARGGAGGAIWVNGSMERSAMQVSYSIVSNNTAKTGGGAVAIDGYLRGSNVELLSCSAFNNWAGQRGGFFYVRDGFADSSQLRVSQTLTEGSGSRYGGPVYVGRSLPPYGDFTITAQS